MVVFLLKVCTPSRNVDDMDVTVFQTKDGALSTLRNDQFYELASEGEIDELEQKGSVLTEEGLTLELVQMEVL